jgi:hypothetical protein
MDVRLFLENSTVCLDVVDAVLTFGGLGVGGVSGLRPRGLEALLVPDLCCSSCVVAVGFRAGGDGGF